MTRSRPARRRPLPTSPFPQDEVIPPPMRSFSPGDRVTHDHLGLGRVVAVDPGFVSVDFGEGTSVTFPADTQGLHPL